VEAYRPRLVEPVLAHLLTQLPAVMLIGPRATGKTTTARRYAATMVRFDRAAEAAAFLLWSVLEFSESHQSGEDTAQEQRIRLAIRSQQMFLWRFWVEDAQGPVGPRASGDLRL